jgi:hypothetical protein
VAIRIFQHYWQLPLALLAFVEASVFFGAAYGATWFMTGVPPAGEPASEIGTQSLLFAGLMFLCMTAMGLYNARQRSRLAGLLARVAASVVAGTMLSAVVF